MSTVVREGNCGTCGYDLGGLPMVGRCPECGAEYDGYTRSGFGSHTAMQQAKLDRRLARARTGCLAGIGLMALLCAGFATVTGWGEPARAFAIGLLFALFFGFCALVSFVCEKPSE